MGRLKAFMEIPRQEAGYRPILDRVKDFSEVEQTLNTRQRREQASRCMDCGVPFCHWKCPLGNKQPEWNDALYRGEWEEAYGVLNTTNDFPEFTGRVCPAECEKACVLNMTMEEPVTNRENEAAITEVAWREGYITPRIYKRNGRKIAVVGSGPAGLVVANRLNKMGYEVTIFDRNEAAGGLLRHGIPNFKLNKAVIDRRTTLMERENIHFVFDTEVDVLQLMKEGQLPDEMGSFDAYIVATGTPQARDLVLPGRELKGIYFALDLLSQQNRILAGREFMKDELVSARGKDVLVIGGGDTGSDCVGTAHRQNCRSVTQIEIMPRPEVVKTTSSHEEGCTRRWNINSLEFLGERGQVTGVRIQPIEWVGSENGQKPRMVAVGEEEIIRCNIVFLSLGFLRQEMTPNTKNVFLAGDVVTGPTLVVRAMASGRDIAYRVNDYLTRG